MESMKPQHFQRRYCQAGRAQNRPNELSYQCIPAYHRRYSRSCQLLTGNREADNVLPVPENVTLSVKVAQIARIFKIELTRFTAFCYLTPATGAETRQEAKSECIDASGVRFFVLGIKTRRERKLAKQRLAYTYRQLAEITPYTARTWRWRVEQGKVRAVRDGAKAVMILHKDLEAYFASLPERKPRESEDQPQKTEAQPQEALTETACDCAANR
jgi:hypothetical protein